MKTTFLSTAMIAGLLLGPASADVFTAAESANAGTYNSADQFGRTVERGHVQTDELRTAGLFSGSFGLPVPQQWQQRAVAPASGYRTPGYTTPQYTAPNGRVPYGSTNSQYGVRGNQSPGLNQWNHNLNSRQNCVNGQCLSPAGRINGFDTPRYNQTRPMNQSIPRNHVPDYSVQRSSFY